MSSSLTQSQNDIIFEKEWRLVFRPASEAIFKGTPSERFKT
jgi:hypothetical protein